MSRRPLLVLCVLSLLLAAAGPARAQTTLRYKYKEGDSIPYKFEQNMKMAMSVAGKDIEITMDMAMDIAWQIKKVHEDGKADIVFKFGAAKVGMDSPLGKVAVSSTDEEEPNDKIGQVMYQLVKVLGNLEITGQQSVTGEVSDVKIPEKALKQLKKLAGAGGPGAGGMLSADSLKGMVSGTNGLVLPKGEISKGKTWTHKTTTKTELGDAEVEMKYTYEGSKDGLESIAFKPVMNIKPKEDSPVTIKIKSTEGKGKALFDNQAGQLKESNVTQVIEMELEVGGMSIGQTMTIAGKMRQAKSK